MKEQHEKQNRWNRSLGCVGLDMSSRLNIAVLWVAFGLLAVTVIFQVWAMGRTVDRLEQVIAGEHLPYTDTHTHGDVDGHENVDEIVHISHEHPHQHVVIHAHPRDDDHGSDISELPTTTTTETATTTTEVSETTAATTTTLAATTTTETATTTTEVSETTAATTTTLAAATTTTTLPPDAHAHVVDHDHDHDPDTIILIPANPQIIFGGRNPITIETVPPTTLVGQ